ncbi:MAG: BREX system P-loop protein BrxC [Leptospiraceae bacterium]|nr:BREX system P-loop protein BrxC [Leptospiraceae bacterium]
MIIKEILNRDITKTIDPVIYFNQKKPEVLEREVSEYVITSNEKEESGIHEQYVRLLTALSKALQEGESLPAVWISGFFGSGKSSFAKLLGLSLGGLKLPGGKLLSDALIERDDTPNSIQFKKAWEDCKSKFKDTVAVVFDISAEARTMELPASVIYRMIQVELGYSDKEAVAKYELSLQRESKYDLFLEKYKEHYKTDWDKEKHKTKAPDEFSLIYHQLYPNEFPKPSDWFKTHYTKQALKEADAIRQAVKEIAEMMKIHHPGKRLLIVIDEMSQFIGKNTDRMLNLQSFVSEIGAIPGCPIWLFVTGQEKLEDNVPGIEISKMQDRFPSKYRVHLHKTNVKEIVRRRILQKSENKRKEIEDIFTQDVLSRVKLNGYDADRITEDELIDFYPLLPSYIPLLLEISQSIKAYSTKAQADSDSVRSVLQTVFDLFNNPRTNFKDRKVGELVTLKDVYQIIGSSLGSEIAQTIDKISSRLEKELPEAVDIARIIAILELNSEKEPVSMELLQKMTFANLFENPSKEIVQTCIERLERENFIYLEDKKGYRIKDTVAQEWGKDRDRIPVSEEELLKKINEFSFAIFDSMTRPRISDIPLELEISFSGRTEKSRPLPKVRLDLNYSQESLFETTQDFFIKESQREIPTNFSKEKILLLTPGKTDLTDEIAKTIIRTEKMLGQNQGNLSQAKQKVYDDEKRKLNKDKDRLTEELVRVWDNGKLYCMGREIDLRFGGAREQFLQKLKSKIEGFLPELFSRFKEALVNVTMKDTEKLFEPEIVSPQSSLLDGAGGLGILTKNSGRYEPVTDSGIPKRVLEYVKEKISVRGENLIGYFGSQPFGYPSNVILAVTAGLLRAETIKIKQPGGKEATSYRDEGIKDSILNQNSFRGLDIQPNVQEDLGGREKKECRDFFEKNLGIAGVELDSSSINKAIFDHFPSLIESLVQLKKKINSLALEVPEKLEDFHKDLDLARKDTSVAGSVRMLYKLLPDLKLGNDFYSEAKRYLTPENETRLTELIKLRDHQIKQLIEYSEEFKHHEDILKIIGKTKDERPWKDIADYNSSMNTIRTNYSEIRRSIITKNRLEMENAWFQLERRNGFEKLTEEEIEQVKSTLESSSSSMDPESLYPNLLQLKNLFFSIEQDKVKANDLFDELISRKEQIKEIRKVKHGLSNKEINTKEELDKVLEELKKECTLELEKGYSIRLV